MKIICIAKNYGKHIAEMGGWAKETGAEGAIGGVKEASAAMSDGTKPEPKPAGADGGAKEAGSGSVGSAKTAGLGGDEIQNRCGRSHPIFFLKPDTALLRNNDPFYVPDFSSHIDYECELVVRINRVGRSIAEKFAHRYYSEVTLGIDFTARDQQRAAMAEGLPWEAAKAFDHSAALAPEWMPLAELGKGVGDLNFEMRLDGEVRQTGWTGDMIFGIDRVIAHVSRFITLKIGDLIYTGTPAGVGAVAPGQRLTATLEGRELLNFEIR